MDLQRLTHFMVADGLTAEYAAAAEDDVPEQVRITVQPEGFRQPLTLSVTRVEVPAESSGGFDMFQLFAPVPVAFEEEQVHALLPLVMAANEAVPLIGFGADVDSGYLYYRNVVLAPAGDEGSKLVTEAAWMALFALDLHAAELVRSAAT